MNKLPKIRLTSVVLFNVSCVVKPVRHVGVWNYYLFDNISRKEAGSCGKEWNEFLKVVLTLVTSLTSGGVT
jgi:hypothetical protein